MHSNVWILYILVDMIPGVSKNHFTYRQIASNIKMLIEKSPSVVVLAYQSNTFSCML